MEDGRITDGQLSMSSYLKNDAAYGEKNGRLNKKTWPYGAQVNCLLYLVAPAQLGDINNILLFSSN